MAAVWLGCTTPEVAGCVQLLPDVEERFIIPSGTVTVDGSLSEWADADWHQLDKVYFGDPCDINYVADPNSAVFAVKWDDTANRVYVAAVIDDQDHVLAIFPEDWDDSDRIEIYAQGDPNGGVDYGTIDGCSTCPRWTWTRPSSTSWA